MDANELLIRLADGEYHSGERLGAAAGLTRAAVWKQIRKLEKWGLNIETSSGRGYRLSQPVELFDSARLAESLTRNGDFDVERIDIFTELDSTNQFLLDKPPSKTNTLCLSLAEWQSAGRGRRQRHWESPLGSGICLSAAWTFAGIPENFSALSLAAGAAIADAIAADSGIDVELKWPNDIVWNDRKLGGILLESRIEAHGNSHVVIGAGINYAVPDDLLVRMSDWDAGAVDLRTAARGATVGRNALAGGIACRLGNLLSEIAQGRQTEWQQDWRRMDYLRGKMVRVGTDADVFEGRADGIDEDGALRVVSESGVTRRIVAGEASVRPQ